MRPHEAKVLLIEDDSNVRATLKAMLEEMNIYNIQEAENGIEALRYIDDNYFNLILCDWNLPQKTGIELLREIRQSHPDVPFVMITARADKESVTLARENDVTSYICKPVNFQDLEKKIKFVIKHLND